MNWGKAIVLVFVVFAAIIIFMVVVSMRQDVSLVSEDYYRNELEYESRIVEKRNTEALPTAPVISLDRGNESVIIQFPEDLSNRVRAGQVVLFRPSSAKDDFSLDLNLDENHLHRISMKGRKKGLWQVMLHWETLDKQYYDEKNIRL